MMTEVSVSFFEILLSPSARVSCHALSWSHSPLRPPLGNQLKEQWFPNLLLHRKLVFIPLDPMFQDFIYFIYQTCLCLIICFFTFYLQVDSSRQQWHGSAKFEERHQAWHLVWVDVGRCGTGACRMQKPQCWDSLSGAEWSGLKDLDRSRDLMAGNVWLPECCAKPEGGQELDHLMST